MIAGLSFIGRTSPICPRSSRTTSAPRPAIQPAHDSVLSSSTEPTEPREHHAANVRPPRRPTTWIAHFFVGIANTLRAIRGMYTTASRRWRRRSKAAVTLPTPRRKDLGDARRRWSSRIFSLAESNRDARSSPPLHVDSVSSMCASMISSVVAAGPRSRRARAWVVGRPEAHRPPAASRRRERAEEAANGRRAEPPRSAGELSDECQRPRVSGLPGALVMELAGREPDGCATTLGTETVTRPSLFWADASPASMERPTRRCARRRRSTRRPRSRPTPSRSRPRSSTRYEARRERVSFIAIRVEPAFV